MKLITKEEWEKLTFAVYSTYAEDDYELPQELCIKYGKSAPNDYWSEEEFPIVIPEYEDCFDYQSTINKFLATKSGCVSSLETTKGLSTERDVMYIIYERKDIEQWISKLQSMLIGLEANQ